MSIKKLLKGNLLIVILFLLITAVFFHKSIISGHVPFPGDILISEYSPWKYDSYLGYNPGSYPNKAQYFDVIRQLYPWKVFSIEQVKSGELPLWNPYNFSGSPLLANNQSAPFYPLNVLFLTLPFVLAWTIYIFLQPLLASLFTYIYLRSVKASKAASIFSSIAFGFSLFMTVFLEYGNIGHTFIWLPLILYGIEKSLKKLTWNSLLIPLGIIASGLAGHLQIFVYVIIFCLFYLLVRIIQEKIKNLYKISSILLLFILSFGALGFQLIPVFELINNSARAVHDYSYFISNLLIQWDQLILLLSPDIFGNPVTRNYLLPDSYPGNAMYIGMAAFTVSLFSLYELKRKIPFLFFLSLILVFVFTLRWPFSEFLYSLNLPFVSSSSPSNSLFLLAFSLSILSGFGFDRIAKIKKIKDYIPVFAVILIIALIWSTNFIFNIELSLNNLILSTALLATVIFALVLYRLFKKKLFLYLLIPLLIADLLFFFVRFNPFVPKELVFPQSSIENAVNNFNGIDRWYGYGSAHIDPNFQTQLKMHSVEGYDPLYIKDYGKLIYSHENRELLNKFDSTSRSNALLDSLVVDNEITEESQKLINLLGVRYILDREESATSEETFPVDSYEQVYDENGWKILENSNSLPRYFLVNNYEKYSTDDEFTEKFYSEDFSPRNTLLLENNVSLDLDEDASGSVELISYKPNEIELQTNTNGDMLLFMSDTYYEGWQARVNNENSKIYKANYAFRAVEIPEGESRVIFKYAPLSFYTGIKVTIISLVALIVLGLIIKYGIYKKS